MDYVAIDFETANAELSSACSIGIVAVTNDKIIYEKEYLINPQEEFSEFNITIHRITADMVVKEKTFAELWPEIKHFFFNTLVFAHNADFDVSVLRSLIEKYNLDVPNIKTGCTLKIAQRIWKNELPNCRLNTLSDYLELIHHHHNALSDAFVCTKIIERAKRVKNVASEGELYQALGLVFGGYNEHKYWPSTKEYKKARTEDIVKVMAVVDKVIAFGGKPKTTTKKAFVEKLLISGACIARSINRSVDYFICLENCPKTKLAQVQLYKNKGCKIITLEEKEILELLNDKTNDK